MNPSNSRDDTEDMWLLTQLTAKQKRLIYEEEKRRIEKTSPLLARRAKLIIAGYFLGCLVIYSGIIQNFFDTWELKLKPETHFLDDFFVAIWTLARPFAVLFLGAMAYGIILGLWYVGSDFIKRLTKHGNGS